jgi:hypothetical protein
MRGAVSGVPDVLKDAAVALDRLRRGDVTGFADDQHPFRQGGSAHCASAGSFVTQGHATTDCGPASP